MRFLQNKENNTCIYNKTKLYNITRSIHIPNQSADTIPNYKIILSKLYVRYEKKCKENDSKVLSLNSMKSKYGLPNNLNNYFITNPNHEFAQKPTTIQIKNAYKLILILQMDKDTANNFLESLNFSRLDSPVADDLARAIYYCLRCSYDIDKTNEFIIDNKLPALF